MRKVFYLMCLFFCLSQNGCTITTKQKKELFENYLESFIGKKITNTINALGYPTKFIKKTNETYIVYDYRPDNNCIIMFKYKKKSLEIVDWDYEGNCLLIDDELKK